MAVIDSWRCMLCGELMYNTEVTKGVIYPMPGGPPYKSIGKKLSKVCQLCYDMYVVDVALGKEKGKQE